MTAAPDAGPGTPGAILADLAGHPASSARQVARRLGMNDRDVYRVLKAAEASGRCRRHRETPSAPWLWEVPLPSPEPPWRYQATAPDSAGLVHVAEMWTRRTPHKRALCGDLAGEARPDAGLAAATCAECARLLGLRRAAGTSGTAPPGN